MNERAIFFEAMDLEDAAERTAFLDQTCSGDAALRQRIEELLRCHANAGAFLARPAPQQLAAGADTPEIEAATAHGETPPRRPTDAEPLDFLAAPSSPGTLGGLG